MNMKGNVTIKLFHNKPPAEKNMRLSIVCFYYDT
jgi:hypothetical protein